MTATANGGNGLLKYANVISTLGVPVVIALFMVWWITNLVGKDLREAQNDRRQIIDLIRDQNHQMDANYQTYSAMLYNICIGLADNDYKKAVCNQQPVAAPPPRSGDPKERR
jgi:hypothetical protein